jgi:hypothetical protein
VVRRRNTNTQYSNPGGERDIYCAFPQIKIGQNRRAQTCEIWALAPPKGAATADSPSRDLSARCSETPPTFTSALCVRLPTGLNPKPSQE